MCIISSMKKTRNLKNLTTLEFPFGNKILFRNWVLKFFLATAPIKLNNKQTRQLLRTLSESTRGIKSENNNTCNLSSNCRQKFPLPEKKDRNFKIQPGEHSIIFF